MKFKIVLPIVIAIVLIAGGSLLAAKGQDAVSQAENRKQGILDAQSTTIFYDKKQGVVELVNVEIGHVVQKGDLLLKVKSAEGDIEEVLSPEDGLISRMAIQSGDQLMPGLPLGTLQQTEYYTDLYVQEGQIEKLKLNQNIKVQFPYTDQKLEVGGRITSITAAPQFASSRMTREKGQADVSMFQVRVAIAPSSELLPGMTAEVDLNEIVH